MRPEILSLLLMLAIQSGAREFFFAGLMVGGLVLFAERDRLAPVLPVIGVGYVAWLLRGELSALLGVG